MAIGGVMLPFNNIAGVSKADEFPNPISVLSARDTIEAIKEAEVYVANNNGINSDIFVRMSTCENQGLKDICIIDTNGKLSCGVFMFQEDTFKRYCPDLTWGKGHLADNIVCAGRVMAKGIEVVQSNWVICSQKEITNIFNFFTKDDQLSKQ